MSRAHWLVDGNSICNPRNEIVATVVVNLPSIRRQELIDHIEMGAVRAYRARRAFESIDKVII